MNLRALEASELVPTVPVDVEAILQDVLSISEKLSKFYGQERKTNPGYMVIGLNWTSAKLYE